MPFLPVGDVPTLHSTACNGLDRATFMEESVQGYSLKPLFDQDTSRQTIDLLSTGKPTEPAVRYCVWMLGSRALHASCAVLKIYGLRPKSLIPS